MNRRSGMDRLARRSQRGYILALNILVLAMMLVGATYIGQRMTLARTLAQIEQQRVADDVALASARARVLFLLATVARTTEGLGRGAQAVALDNREYRVEGRVRVRIQDVRGLIGLNATRLDGTGRDVLERLQGSYGIDGITAHILTDRLLDYRDADSLRRLDGAEQDDYRLGGRETFIRNGDLRTPAELGRILSWADQPSLWQADPLTDHVHPDIQTPFNPNTATWRTLSAMANLPPDVARNLVDRRRQDRTLDLARLAFGSGVDDPFVLGASIARGPGAMLRVTLQREGAAWGLQLFVTHTPVSQDHPWHIDSARKVSLPPATAPLDIVPPLPEATALRDFDAKDRIEWPF